MPSFSLPARILTASAISLALIAASASAAQADPAPLAACTSYGSVYTSDLATWNTSDTRATGHQEILAAGGLHLFTEGATSTDKVAGYFSTNFALSAIGAETIAQAMDFSGLAGATVPGLQVVVDINGDGVADGILVGEPIYGNEWWLNGSASTAFQALAPHTGGGYGSNNWGALAEWSAAIPNARVLAVGYSLGSGVHNDGVLSRITLGCVNYTWGPAPTTAQATANADASSAANGTDVTITSSATTAPTLASTGVSGAEPLAIAALLALVGSVVFWFGRRRPLS